MSFDMYGWDYYLEQVFVSQNSISLRLLPMSVNLDCAEPAISIYVKNPSGVDIEDKLRHFESKPVCRIESSIESVVLWGESVDESINISGVEISITNMAYSESELKKVAISLRNELEETDRVLSSLYQTLSEADAFIDELICRTEIAVSQSSTDAGFFEMQIDALKQLKEKLKNF
jgi:hypothetical protein